MDFASLAGADGRLRLSGANENLPSLRKVEIVVGCQGTINAKDESIYF